MSRKRAGNDGRDTTWVALSDADRFKAVADYTYDWESWVDGDGVLQWVNPAVRNLTGYGVDECHAMPDYPLPIVHPVDRPYLAQVLRGAREGTRGNDLEFRVLRKDGMLRWVAMSWQSIRDRKRRRLGFRTSVRDIDERKRIEVRLHAAKIEAEAAARAKSELLAIASHELRTPLQSVHGHAELLLAECATAAQRKRVTTILQQTEGLLHIVGDMLVLASNASALAEPAREPLEPRALVDEVLQALAPAAERKRLPLRARVASEVPQVVLGDAARVRRILLNVVGNAIKFTERGRVEVVVSGAARGAKARVSFSVRDTGIGLPPSPEAIERLFEPFSQADASIGRRYGGTGLGLSIVRRLCESLGGSVRAARRRSGGAVFDVELPFSLPAKRRARRAQGAATQHAPRQALADASFAQQHPCEILVVDDSPVVRELLVERLRALGYAPDAVDGATAALVSVGTKAYSLVLLDVQMPGIDGIVAAELLRARLPPHASTRIVALTADVFAEQSAGDKRHALDGFLIKPVRMPELRELLTRTAAETAASRRSKGADAKRSRARPKPPRTRSGLGGELDARVVDDLLEQRDREGEPVLRKLVAPLSEGSLQLLDALRERIAAQDFEQAARLAHRLRGDAAVVGASRAASLAGELEQALEARDTRAIGSRVRALEGALSRARARLTALLEQSAGTAQR